MLLLIMFTVLKIANYSPCVAYRRFSSVVIHDPARVSQYFTDTVHTENIFKTEFAEWSFEEVKKNCFYALVDGAFFIITDQQEVDHVSDVYPFDRRLLHTQLHISFFLREGDWNTSSTETQENVLGTPMHHCMSTNGDTDEARSFAIASAHQHDALFLLMKNSNDSKYKAVAIVEPVPTFNLQALRKKDVEAVYVTGKVQPDEEEESAAEQESEEDDFSFEDSFEDDDYYHRVCELEEFRKHRLCATVYVAWMQYKNDVYRDLNYIVRPGNACMRKAKILLTEKVPMKIIEADLLPCSIQTDSSKSQVFVANDHFTNDSAFVLEPVHANDESAFSEESVDDEILGYRLVLHLYNVLSLKRPDEEE